MLPPWRWVIVLKNVSVLIHHELCAEFDTVAAACGERPETGGILMGCYRGDDLEVTSRTRPGPTDRSSLFSFIRVDRSHQTTAMSAWSATRGTHTWVGEWHTHPHGGVSPSSTDLSSWSRLSRNTQQLMAFVLVVPGDWGLFVVRPSWLRRRAVRLTVIEEGMIGRVFASRPRQ